MIHEVTKTLQMEGRRLDIRPCNIEKKKNHGKLCVWTWTVWGWMAGAWLKVLDERCAYLSMPNILHML